MAAIMYMPVVSGSGVISICAVRHLSDALQLSGIIIRTAPAKIRMRVLIDGRGALRKPLVERIIEQAAGILRGRKCPAAPF